MLVDAGIIPIYNQILLTKKDPNILDQAVWGLGNIAGDCTAFRDLVLQNNTMASLSNLYSHIKAQNTKMSEDIIWAASNLCR